MLGNEITIGQIGIGPSEETVIVKYGLFQSLGYGTQRLWDITSLTFQALFKLVSGGLSLQESITGPLGIFFATTKAFKFGLAALLHVLGVLGVSLAIFNLLPIPLLDGGHLLFLTIEKIKGKPVSVKTEEFLNKISLGFLLFLVVVVFYNDLVKYRVLAKMMKLFSSL